LDELTDGDKNIFLDNLKECQQNYQRVGVNIVDKIVDISNSKEEISKSVTDIPRIYRR